MSLSAKVATDPSCRRRGWTSSCDYGPEAGIIPSSSEFLTGCGKKYKPHKHTRRVSRLGSVTYQGIGTEFPRQQRRFNLSFSDWLFFLTTFSFSVTTFAPRDSLIDAQQKGETSIQLNRNQKKALALLVNFGAVTIAGCPDSI